MDYSGFLVFLTALFGLGFVGIIIFASRTGGDDPLAPILIVFCGGAFLAGTISLAIITKLL